MLDEIVMRADSVMMIKLATKKDFQLTTTKFTIVNKSLKRKARRLEGKSVSFLLLIFISIYLLP